MTPDLKYDPGPEFGRERDFELQCEQDQPTKERVVTMKQFVGNAKAILERVEREGAIVVTDDTGRPIMSIHCPRDSLPVGD